MDDDITGFRFKIRDDVYLQAIKANKEAHGYEGWYLGFRTGKEFIAVAKFISRDDFEFTYQMLKDMAIFRLPEES